jgi:hypothetical protein
MKKVIVLSAAAFAMMLSVQISSATNTEQANSSDSTKKKTEITKQIFNQDTTKLKKGEKFYQCEMDLKVISNKPGKCPKCGMKLTENKKK